MSSSSITINNIKQSTIISTQVFGISLFIIGVIGHTLSIYVFTRRIFRSNPCVCYFLASTLSGCVVVYINIPLKLLQVGYNIDVFTYSVAMCQSLTYILNSVRVLPSWFIALASIDRFLCSSSSVTLRGWSSMRIAYRAIPCTILFIGIAFIHVPFYNTILLPQRSCSIASVAYRSFFGIWNLVFWSWIPTICMLVFGLLTIRHIRQGSRRIVPQNTGNLRQRDQKKINRQLFQMLLIQSFVFGATTTILSIGNLYVSITSNLIVKNDIDKANDTLLVTIVNWIATIGPCTNFYLFVLSSQLFRGEVIKLFLWRRPTSTANTITASHIPQTRN
ncbi:unnamed protein product [Adineta steineri]|uniref:G-protein coupled receptors family 1 profile domain-containing protein n=1 Tax=Adineta steineri TaxID=433720 RepID=A0A815QG00_9BILA|nr:unnamed protein product [Adineta steineri]CAF1633451.1 unnamed protein product [Adineta steineri]